MSDIPSFWRSRNFISWLLWPLSLLMHGIVYSRQHLFYRKSNNISRSPVPIIVIGNLTVGGNGKTPIVMALSKALSSNGYQVGIVSRGYGGSAQTGSEVFMHSEASIVGDEALLIKQQCQVPVFIDKKRNNAVLSLIKHYPQTQIIISDDGLQHYAMTRSLEWVVIARDIGLGNGFLLPAGPLREPISRLLSVDKVLLHGTGDFKLPAIVNKAKVETLVQANKGFRLLSDSLKKYQPISAFTRYNYFSALTAIARPERFFATLQTMGIHLIEMRTLPDHAKLSVKEADFSLDSYLIVTEKDAVKTTQWPLTLKERTLVLAHELELPPSLIESAIEHIENYGSEDKQFNGEKI